MKIQREFPVLQITKKGERALLAGHPWVYDAEVTTPQEGLANGSIVDVVSEKGRYLGTGLLSLQSKIRIRLISRSTNDVFNEAFWERRLRYAWQYRKNVLRSEDLTCCRVIFGEADSFPGLTVDRFCDLLVTQTLSVGMELLKPVIFPALVRVLREDGQQISGIFERNDVAIRRLEGLEEYKGFYPLAGERIPESAVTRICENGIFYDVDVENGQKTGFFLDQKYNRLAVMQLARGKRVLDCFTHTGSFALNAAKGGALSVCAADISESAIQMARHNAALNGLEERMEFTVCDIFELLPKIEREGKKPYDFIILDPPAFTKSRKTVDSAKRGYKEINYRALKVLPRGGYFATASCSHFMPDKLFVQMLRDAAADAQVQLRQIEARQQSPDHPILWNVPETDYLKFYLFQVV